MYYQLTFGCIISYIIIVPEIIESNLGVYMQQFKVGSLVRIIDIADCSARDLCMTKEEHDIVSAYETEKVQFVVSAIPNGSYVELLLNGTKPEIVSSWNKSFLTLA
jgi:hypothetical protein